MTADTTFHSERKATSPNVHTIYPEYISDFNVFVCPSDSEWGTDDINNPVTGDPDLQYLCDTEDGTYFRGATLLGTSYVYLGWVIDKGDEDPRHTVPAADTYFTPETQGWPADALLSAQLCAQVLQTGANVFTPVEIYATYSQNDIAITDATIDNCGGPRPAGFGNGGNDNTLYRLREGIERFMITDINNAGASAESQSEIFVYFDRVSFNVSRFNHIPGGSNVLYMDGHVSFVKYPSDKAPVASSTSYLMTLGSIRPPS